MVRAQRFLAKMRGAPAGVSLAFDGGIAKFKTTPLFTSIGQQPGPMLATAFTWQILEPEGALATTENPWDACHRLATQNKGMAGGVDIAFIEPDLEQHWLWGSVAERAQTMTAACVADPPNTGYPAEPYLWWYQDQAHSQFEEALAALGAIDGTARVRVAHMDTGYDPEHRSLPRWLEPALQRNFVDDGNAPNDATDHSTGLFNNLGHGTGTLSILAGSGTPHGGAAPFVAVVPLRVANRVELFYNSAIAQAFDYVHSLCAAPQTEVQVVTMSMGGLASQAWAEAVNALYEAGVVVVTAAGNNYGNKPTHNIVYPARFGRVIAACGVMADGSAYADLPIFKMAGNYGPDSKMTTALSAYTPNVPWARYGCPDVLNFDGQGTSAATPQVAAAAAIWLQKHQAECAALPEKWMRVEAVRQALFGTGLRAGAGPDPHLGMGALRAAAALGLVPNPATLVQTAPDRAGFVLFKVLGGFGMEEADDSRRRMLELEALQLSQDATIESLLPDPALDPATLAPAQLARIAQALADHPRASRALRDALRAVAAPPAPPRPAGPTPIEQQHLQNALAPQPPAPIERRLRVYAYDPSLGRDLATAAINQATLSVPWEAQLAPGPVGEYVEVVDVDPASGCCYAPVDLNDPRLIASDGLGPSETNPQFHQQMAYAVVMTTVQFFEKALGRVALWPARCGPDGESPAQPAAGMGEGGAGTPGRHEDYVPRLRIYPHAKRDVNAYYSPHHRALLLGYFTSQPADDGAPSELVFSALSHDVIAHETTHALLDGVHPRFREPTNRDVLAFHEAFADIVALFQHFSLPESLRAEIARSRGNLADENLLAKLAVQFGQATGSYGALRDAIGTMERDQKGGEYRWTRAKPARDQYRKASASLDQAHALGAVLVAAVFDAFLQIYQRRAQEPILLATQGSGVLPPGELASGLVDALAGLASKVASHVLTMCIRATDYCAPFDNTFGDYLRAIVTADRELVPIDPYGYRIAFMSAFAARGIYPRDVRSLSVETVLWEPPPVPFPNLDKVLSTLDLGWDLRANRYQAWRSARANAVSFRNWLLDPALVDDVQLQALGLRRNPQRGAVLASAEGAPFTCEVRGIEVHSVRPARRVGPDGNLLSQLVVEATQAYIRDGRPGEVYRGGVTLVLDLDRRAVVYTVRKRPDQPGRISEQQRMRLALLDQATDHYAGLAATRSEPFRFLHRRSTGREYHERHAS